MSTISLLSLLPLLLLWALYRIGRHALVPLLADMKARSVQRSFALPLPTVRGGTNRSKRGLQALTVGGITALIYFWMSLSGLQLGEPAMNIPLTTDLIYSYFLHLDIGLVAGLTLGLIAFAKMERSAALAAFVVLLALFFLYDFAYFIIGPMTFQIPTADLVGRYSWTVYYVGFTAMLTAALSQFSRGFQGAWPWLTMIATGIIGQFIFNDGASPLINILPYSSTNVVAPLVLIGAVAGWWMRPNST